MSRFNSLQDAQQYAADKGYTLTTEDYEAISIAQQKVRERYANADSKTYMHLLQALHGMGEVLLTTAQTVIVAFGVPIALVLMLFVEQQRVRAGISLFEVNVTLTEFASSALVLVNLVIEFVIEYVESTHGYQANTATRFSFRGTWQSARYMFGLQSGWQPQKLSPAQRFRILRRIVTYAILSLALAGSMREVILQQPGAWLEAVQAVLTKSTLLQAATWTGGLMFALAAVLTAQGLSRYVAVKCAEILTRMSHEATSESEARDNEQDLAAAAVIVARVKAEQTRIHTLSASTAVQALSSSVIGQDSTSAALSQDRTGQDRTTKADQALAMLHENPEWVTRKTRDLESETGIGKNHWSIAQRAYREQQP